MVKRKTSKSWDHRGKKSEGENGKGFGLLASASPCGKAAGFCRSSSSVFCHCVATAFLCLGKTALHAGSLVGASCSGHYCFITKHSNNTLTLKDHLIVHSFVGEESESGIPQQCMFLVSRDVPDVAGCICSNLNYSAALDVEDGALPRLGAYPGCQLELSGFPKTHVNCVTFSDLASEHIVPFTSFPDSYQGWPGESLSSLKLISFKGKKTDTTTL